MLSDIDLFGNLAEGTESIIGLIARYTVIEKLYLHEDYEAARGLHEFITELYAARLTYLARAKSYFTGNALSTYLYHVLDEAKDIYLT